MEHGRERLGGVSQVSLAAEAMEAGRSGGYGGRKEQSKEHELAHHEGYHNQNKGFQG